MSWLIDFTKIGGYRLKQATFQKIQETYFWILKSFIGLLQIPDTGNYIISGCQVVGANITSGIMYIDGELCPFSGGVGTLSTKIKKNISISSLVFKNGTSENVFRQTTAIIDASGVELSLFQRIPVVLDANYVHTDNNFTAALLAKLNGIENGAEVNVRTNWNEINPLSDAYLIGKPTIQNILYSGEQLIGNFPSGGVETARMTIPFPSVGTTDYKVNLYIKSISPTASAGQDAIPIVTSNYTESSFDIIGRQFGTPIQNLVIYYDLIQL